MARVWHLVAISVRSLAGSHRAACMAGCGLFWPLRAVGSALRCVRHLDWMDSEMSEKNTLLFGAVFLAATGAVTLDHYTHTANVPAIANPAPAKRPVPGQTRAREIRVPPIRVAQIPVVPIRVGRATTPVQRTPVVRTRAGQGTIRVRLIHVPQARVVPIPVGRAITRAQQHPVRQIRARPIIPAGRQTPVRQARAVHVPPIRVPPITHVLPRRVRRPAIPVLRPTLVPHTIRAVPRTRVRPIRSKKRVI